MSMIAFHGDPGIKAKYLARVAAHRAADQLIQGTGWEDGKGCAVGCTLDGYDHGRYETELGIPERLAHLEDRLFETLPCADAMAWPERFLSAITPGADLSKIWGQWAIWMLVDPEHGVIRFARDRADVRAAIQQVADLYRDGGTSEQFRQAYGAAVAAGAAVTDDDAAYAAHAASAAAHAVASAGVAHAVAYATASAVTDDDAAYAVHSAHAAGAAAHAYASATSVAHAYASATASAYAAAGASAEYKFAIAGAKQLIELLRAAM